MSATTERSWALEQLAAMRKDTPLWTILRHVSKSGMFRIIDVVAIIDGEPRTMIVPELGRRYDYDRNGYVARGCGMDMGFDLVYAIGQHIHGDGYWFKARWL